MLLTLLLTAAALAQPDARSALETIAVSSTAIKAADKVLASADAPQPAKDEAAAARKQRVQAIVAAAEAFPDDPLINLRAAEALIGAEEPALGLVAADRAAALRPSPVTYVQRGMARFGLKDYKGAMEDCGAATALNPRHAGAFSLCKMAEGRSANEEPSPAANPTVQPGAVKNSAPSHGLAQVVSSSKRESIPRASTDPADVWQVIGPARQRMRASEVGAEIDDFMAAKNVQFRLADNLEPGKTAVYDEEHNLVFIDRSTARTDATNLAALLVHEGFHSKQVIAHGMESAVELEEDAYFRQMVAYHQMLRAGIPPSKNAIFADSYDAFRLKMLRGNVEGFRTDVRKLYERHREELLDEKVKSFPDWLRPSAKRLLRLRAPNWLRNTETIDDQLASPLNFFRRPALRATREKRKSEMQWQEQWAKDHRKEFFSQ